MDVSLGRRTASGILFTPSGLSFTFTEKSTRSGAILETNTAAGERNRNRRRLADTNSSCKTRKQATRNPEENVGKCSENKGKTVTTPRSTRTNSSHSRRGASMDLASYCTPRKSRNQSYKVDAMASERTPRGGARRKVPRKASETELCTTLQNSEAPASDAAAVQASDVPWEDNDVVNENHWYIYDPYREMRMDIDNMSYEVSSIFDSDDTARCFGALIVFHEQELLSLEERIGTVSTAISEEDLSKCLKRSKYTSGDCATCSICQA